MHTINSPVIELQHRHRSVRRYLDIDVTESQVATIVAAAQRASSWSNLQAWSVIEVRDSGRKRRIAAAIGGAPYVEEAPVFLVWVADLARNDAVMRKQGVEAETLNLMDHTLVCALDVGIVAQSALLAAESLGLGGVFVGGIRNAPEAVISELTLPLLTFPMVGMAIGVPHPEEATGAKPRLPLTGVLHKEQYDDDAWRDAAAAYDAEYREYFEGQGMTNRSWTETIAARLGKLEAMLGRHTMRMSLREQGLDSN